MSSDAAWHPDPTGRHQHRYWDGGAWTAWVADDGVRSEDPLDAGAATRPAGEEAGDRTGDLESVVAHARLVVEMRGGKSPAGWRSVRDDADQDVARLWCEGEVSRLCDLAGDPVLTVTAKTLGRGYDAKVAGMTVATATGPLATVGYTQARTTRLKCSSDGNRLLTIQFRQSMTGKLTDIDLLDGNDQPVGTIVEADRQARGSTVTARLVLERDPQLTDPVRTLAVVAPIVLDCFLNAVPRG